MKKGLGKIRTAKTDASAEGEMCPTFYELISIASAVRTQLSFGLPKPFLGSGRLPWIDISPNPNISHSDLRLNL